MTEQPTMRQCDYRTARPMMQLGDVILFGGKGLLSALIRWRTGSVVSHAGMVSFGKSYRDELRYRVRVTDSTQIGDRRGVFTRYLSDVVRDYDGKIWWLPLRKEVRSKLDVQAMVEYLHSMRNAEYDLWQVARAGFKTIFHRNLTPVQESSKRVFCSEYVAFALKAAGVDCFPNASTVTPSQLAAAHLYCGSYWQLKGDYTQISEYNSSL